ncbi:hypothetical protein NU195Hw_g8997t1 [Hortaea werneckii]
MAASSSDIRECEQRLDRTYQELKTRHGELGTAVAREFRDLRREKTRLQDELTRAQDTIAHLRDENTRLQDDSSNARLHEEEISLLREVITRLERDGKRKREGKQLQMQSGVRRRQEINTNIIVGPSIEGDNSAVSYAETSSRLAHHRPTPLIGDSPHEMRSSHGRTNAADRFEVLRSDGSSSPDSGAHNSLGASWAADASETDEIMFEPSASPDPASITPHFPFKVFLGTFLDDNDTSTAQTIDFDDLSVEFRQAVVEHTEGWVEKGLGKWPSWDHVVKPHNECVYQKAHGFGSCYWTTIYPRFYTCMTCANQRRMCFKKHGDEVWLLPLPPEVDGNAELGTLGSFVIQHEEGKASTKEKRHLWEEERGEGSRKQANREAKK